MTKKLAEELARYLQEQKVKVCYLHHDIKTPQRTELLNKLRSGVFDCLVGVNLLREGLDLPEVALVAIMDADVESFLRDKRSLIQIIGRAARNVESKVILYADSTTKSMQGAIRETQRRRLLQTKYNKKHDIIPTTTRRDVVKSISPIQKAIAESAPKKTNKVTSRETLTLAIADLEYNQAAEGFDFERAITLRDEWFELKKTLDATV